MSAESSRKTRSAPFTIVTPQPVTDRTIIESVTGFISDVVPQAYSVAAAATGVAVGGAGSGNLTGGPSATGCVPSSESVVWAHFDYCDANDPFLFSDDETNASSLGPSLTTASPPPLLLVLGYTSGVQVWYIPGNSHARLVLNVRQGPVSCFRLLPTPSSKHAHRSGYPDDPFALKRPLVALVPYTGQDYSTVEFISLQTGETVKAINFDHNFQILNILANNRRVAITFSDRIAIFDASTFEDRFTITSCYPNSSTNPNSMLNPNPVALGSRWLAYADRHLRPSRRSAGGADPAEFRFASSFLHTVKNVGKGLRGFGESVASSLGGSTSSSPNTAGTSLPGTGSYQGHNSGTTSNEGFKPGIITIVDLMGSSPDVEDSDGSYQSVIAHFPAHSEAIVAMTFDSEGMLLMTADKCGHSFNVFRIHPHPLGSAAAAVHHLYILQRGDTAAKVQTMIFSSDSRWAGITTLRGTTHVFPITSYGGPIGLRTHTSPYVVNRLSRYHRSAGLTAEGRNSTIPFQYRPFYGNSSPSNSGSNSTAGNDSSGTQSSISVSRSFGPVFAYPNPRMPPFPTPIIMLPLSRLRHGSLGISGAVGGSLPASPSTSGAFLNQQPSGSHSYNIGSTLGPNSQHMGSQRIPQVRRTVSAEDAANGIVGLNIRGGSVRVATCFAPPRAFHWIQSESSGTGNASVSSSRGSKKKMCDSLYVWSFHSACLYEFELEPKPISSISKEKQCDDTQIELEIKSHSEWIIPGSSTPNVTQPITYHLNKENPLLLTLEHNSFNSSARSRANGHPESDDNNCETLSENEDSRWLSQVEINTHYGPHRRLWMGPQITFKTYTEGGSETEAVDVIHGLNATGVCLGRTSPVNIGHQLPVLIESGSANSLEHSPRYGFGASSHHGPHSLREQLADAMLESPGASRDIGCANSKSSGSGGGSRSHAVEKVVNPLGTVITLGSTEGLLAEVTDENDAVRWPSDVKKTPPKITVAEEAYFTPSIRTKGPTLKPQRNPLVLTKKKSDSGLDKQRLDHSGTMTNQIKREDLEEYFSLESEANLSKISTQKFNEKEIDLSIHEDRMILKSISQKNDEENELSKSDRPVHLEGLCIEDNNKKEVLDSCFTLEEEKNCSKEDLDTYFSSEDEGQSRLKISSSNSEKEFNKDDPDLYFSTEDESGGGGSKSEQSEWFPTSLSDLETEASITSTQISSPLSSSSNGNSKNKSGRKAKKKRR